METAVVETVINRDGTSKAGECVQLRIDPESTPANCVLWESMGYYICLTTATPRQAITLYNALLTVTEVEAD